MDRYHLGKPMPETYHDWGWWYHTSHDCGCFRFCLLLCLRHYLIYYCICNESITNWGSSRRINYMNKMKYNIGYMGWYTHINPILHGKIYKCIWWEKLLDNFWIIIGWLVEIGKKSSLAALEPRCEAWCWNMNPNICPNKMSQFCR